MRRLAVSSWSLNGLLQSGTDPLELPRQLQQHGITTLELCHFHLHTTDSTYLESLKEALQAAGVELFSVLIDAGDIANPNPQQRDADMTFTYTWIDHAVLLGASWVRICAGRQHPTPTVIAQSAKSLLACADYATTSGLKVSTENWLTTAQNPVALRDILERCQGRVGLWADTGNAEVTHDKYDTIAQLLPYANAVHFKARYTTEGEIDREDMERCLELIRIAPAAEVISLIYDRKQDEWDGIKQLREALTPVL
jgi:sugar phosphate isomerase/epimerase